MSSVRIFLFQKLLYVKFLKLTLKKLKIKTFTLIKVCAIMIVLIFVKEEKMIYFDNSATTIPYPEVLRTYQEVASKIFGNPSSLHNLGTKASRILEASRKQIADLLGVKSTEIIFTSGGTESDNWVLKGVAFEKERYGKHIIVSDIEHPAVKESAKWLSEHGFDVSYAPVNDQGFGDQIQLWYQSWQ